MEVGEQGVVEGRLRVVTQRMANVAQDPLAGRPRAVRAVRRVMGRLHGLFASVDQHGGAVGKNVQGSVAAAGADLVNIERPWLPGCDLTANDILRAHRQC